MLASSASPKALRAHLSQADYGCSAHAFQTLKSQRPYDRRNRRHTHALPIGTVGITITPATASVGSQVTVVATVTNNTSSTVSAALGIQNPDYASERITGVTGGACATRNLQKLIYCGNPQLLPGATASITVTLTPTATGVDDFTVYGRITGNDDTYAYGTLTVS
jgi:hypothetical protein